MPDRSVGPSGVGFHFCSVQATVKVRQRRGAPRPRMLSVDADDVTSLYQEAQVSGRAVHDLHEWRRVGPTESALHMKHWN